MKIKGREVSNRKTARMVIGFILLTVGIYIIVNGYEVWPHVNSVTLSTNYNENGKIWPNPFPAYSVHFIFKLTTVGSVSMSNAVNVSVQISQISMTNVSTAEFLQYYDGVGFTGAYDPTTITGNNPQAGEIYVHSDGGGNYSGAGQVVWLQSGPTFPYLVPNGKYYVNYDSFRNFSAAFNISGESDTLAIQSSLNDQRLTYVLIGFSVLMLQPILEAVARLGQD